MSNRSLAIGVLAVLLFSTAHVSAEDSAAVRLRVLSYNIHHGAGVDGKLDLERIARVIRAAQPDLVALQEVDRNVKRTNVVDQPEELAKLCTMHVVFGANIDLQGGEYGNAVLSRLTIRSSKNHRLPNIDEGEQRGALDAEITIPGVEFPLQFLSTHFDHRPDNTARLASAKVVNELVAKSAGRPALLAGDLNDTPDSETLRILASTWNVANSKPLPTVPVDEPKRQIDYVLLRPAARWKVVDVRVLKEAVASDHRAILAVLELLPAE